MPASFDNSGKPAYMYDSVGDTWYAFGAKIDTASAYEWTNTQTFLNTSTFDADVIFKDGFNNFLNPAARDAAITSPVRGTICFVRQDAGGNSINQIQYYSGSAWTANDGDISQVSAGTGLSGGGTAGNVTLSIDTAVVATTNNTLTMTNKTLTSPTVSGLYLSDSSIVFEGSGGDDANETTLTVVNPTADRTITLPDTSGTVTLTDASQTLSNKTISGTSNTITNVSLTSGVTGTLPVANGGTGITSLGSGVATWLGTPSSANLLAAVTDETGTGSLVFGTSPTITTPIITLGTSTPTFTTNAYTLVSGDQYKFLLASNSSTAGTVNIPTNASVAFPTGTQITLIQTGSGQLTITAATPATTTVLSAGATAASPKLRAQYSSATLIKTATDTWYVVGDIS